MFAARNFFDNDNEEAIGIEDENKEPVMNGSAWKNELKTSVLSKRLTMTVIKLIQNK